MNTGFFAADFSSAFVSTFTSTSSNVFTRSDEGATVVFCSFISSCILSFISGKWDLPLVQCKNVHL